MNSFKHYLLILAISLLPMLPMFTTAAMPHTHDGPVHLARIGAYVKALADGQLVPRWAGDLNYGYGTPLFIFIYHLPYAIAALYVRLGFGLVASFKLLLATSFLLSGVFMFAFAKAFFKNNTTAMVVALFYQFAPFRLAELLIRGSIGEVYTYTFIPLVLLGIWYSLQRPTYWATLLTAIATALLTLSHNSISLVFFGVSLAFLFFFRRSWRGVLFAVLGLFLGLLLTAFYWVPAVAEHKFTYGDLFMKDMYKSHFAPLIQFLLPNFTNDPKLQTGGVPVQFGIVHVFVMLYGVWLLCTNKKLAPHIKKLFSFSLVIAAVTIFFMQPISQIFWEKIVLLRQFQFPWRLIATVVLTSSLLAASLATFKRKWTMMLLTGLMIVSSLLYWRPPLGFDAVDEGYYWNYPLNSTFFGEADVIWAAGPASRYPTERIQIVKGNGTTRNFTNKSNRHTYTINASTEVSVVDHTLYFPGWRVYIDGIKTPVEFQNQLWRGLLLYTIPQGNHQVRVVFEESKVRLVADIISATTGFVMIGGFLFRKGLFRS